jgi:hypothetical protein
MSIESRKKIDNLKFQRSAVQSELGQLNTRNGQIEKDIKTEEDKSKAIRKALILVQALPAKISQTRNRLLRNMERTRREDITIAESKELKTEIETLKMELQKICPHPFVYDEPGYEGSPSQEYENRHPGVRYCVVCGFLEETNKSREVGPLGLQKEYLFKKLVPDDDKRIIEKEPWTSEGRKKIDIWIPLGAVLHPFEKSVARVLNG